MRVKITNSSYGAALKTDAFEEVIRAAIRRASREGGEAHHHRG
jgi:hypothetical protein